MSKILVIVAGLIIAFWLVKRYSRRAPPDGNAPAGSGEDMVRCAKCGLHLPKSESIAEKSEFYCSTEHARERRGQ